MKTKILLVCWKLWRWIYFTPWDLWSPVTMLTILTIFGNFVAMLAIFLPKSEVQCLCLHTGQSHSRKGLGMTCFRASLALVINSYCVGAAKPSQALLLFYWGYSSASIAGTALFDWQKDCQQYILNLNLFINVQIYFDYGSAKVLTLITRRSIQHFQLLSKVRAGSRPKGASLDFRSSSLQINILLCWQIWTNTINLQSRIIVIGVEWALIIAGSQPDVQFVRSAGDTFEVEWRGVGGSFVIWAAESRWGCRVLGRDSTDL